MTSSRNKESPLAFIGIILTILGLAILLICIARTVSPKWVDMGGGLGFMPDGVDVFFCVAPLATAGIVLIMGGYALTSFQLDELRTLFLVFSVLAFALIVYHWTTAPPQDPPIDAVVDDVGYYERAPEVFFLASTCLVGVFGMISIGSFVFSSD